MATLLAYLFPLLHIFSICGGIKRAKSPKPGMAAVRCGGRPSATGAAGVSPVRRQAKPDNCHSGLRPLERDDNVPGPRRRLERGGPSLVQVRSVVARRQRVAVEGID